MVLHFGVITDVHWGPDKETRMGSQAPNLVVNIVNAFNAIKDLDFVVDLGDRIGNIDYVHDLEHLRQFSKVIEKLNAPYYPLLGNHDLRYLSLEDNEKILKKRVGFRSVIIKGIELIFLNAQDPVRAGQGGSIGENQRKDLGKTLSSSERPALVFTHQALDEQDVTNNVYFDEWGKGDCAYVDSREKIRALLEKSGRVKAVFQGHLHWNRLQYHGGIPYITQGSVTETANIPDKRPGGYYSVIRLSKEGLDMTIHGRFSTRFKLSPIELGGKLGG